VHFHAGRNAAFSLVLTGCWAFLCLTVQRTSLGVEPMTPMNVVPVTNSDASTSATSHPVKTEFRFSSGELSLEREAPARLGASLDVQVPVAPTTMLAEAPFPGRGFTDVYRAVPSVPALSSTGTVTGAFFTGSYQPTQHSQCSFSELAPYDEGSSLTSGSVVGGIRSRLAHHLGSFFGDPHGICSNPRHFDVYVGLVVLDRDLGADRVGYTSDGIGATNVVLSTEDLEMEEQPGIQLTLTRSIRAGRTLELNYMGLVEWSADAAVESGTHNLYSALSDFGTNPGPPIAGFLDADQAVRQDISYNSRLHSVDLTLRQRYTSDRCRFNFSRSAGIRFVSLDEDFSYDSNVEQHFDPFSDPNNPTVRGPASLDYDIDVENDLLGAQIGGSAEWCVMPKWRIGGEMRVGLYQNFAEQETRIRGTTLDDEIIREHRLVEEPSSVSELSAYTVYQINPRCKLRVGYYLLHVTQLVLAPDQFNDSPAFVFPPPPAVPRLPTIKNEADLFLSGFTAGFELMW